MTGKVRCGKEPVHSMGHGVEADINPAIACVGGLMGISDHALASLKSSVTSRRVPGRSSYKAGRWSPPPAKNGLRGSPVAMEGFPRHHQSRHIHESRQVARAAVSPVPSPATNAIGSKGQNSRENVS